MYEVYRKRFKENVNDSNSSIFTNRVKLWGAILGYIGSVILASSDGLKIVTPEYTMVSLNIIFSLIISLIYLIPHVRKVSKEKIHEELVREEL